ncbi:MAG: ABC transporter permease [Acidimicrobiia bacterium]|nr:ABC transporter permease [Acidimicrobiia bacterium]
MKRLVALVLSIVLAGFLGASLLRFAPGYGVDEAELDPRLGPDAIARLRQPDQGLFSFYAGFLTALARGDLGVSTSHGHPNSLLIAERCPVTLRSVGVGLLLAWIFAMTGASLVVIFPSQRLDFLISAAAGSFLAVPATVLALLFLYLEAGPAPAIAAVVFPKLFRYVRNLLMHCRELPHVVAARAKGLSTSRTLVWHLLRPSAPQIITLAGLSVNTAITASIPIEALCGSPGIGQLAWTAALARDLPLLVVLTLLVAAATITANFVADAAARCCAPEQA